MRPGTLAPTEDEGANQLVNSDAFALVVGMLLDQQISIAWAFGGPQRLKERLGDRFSPTGLAEMPVDDVVEVFCQKPAVHRFPAVMARRAHELAVYLRDTYGDDVEALWRGVGSGDELGDRVRALPGFGDEKSMIFVAVLAKRFGVAPPGWEKEAGPFADDQPRSVADADGAASRQAIKDWKKAKRDAGLTKQD